MNNNSASRTVCLWRATMVALTLPLLLLCSCSDFTSVYSHKWNYGYPGDPRPADEAILTIHLGTIVSHVDNHGCCIGSPTGVERSGTNYVVRLLPGLHKIQVEPNTGFYEPSIFAKNRYITFEAFAGRHYDLIMEILNFKTVGNASVTWTAKIVEVETSKEFHLDAP